MEKAATGEPGLFIFPSFGFEGMYQDWTSLSFFRGENAKWREIDLF